MLSLYSDVTRSGGRRMKLILVTLFFFASAAIAAAPNLPPMPGDAPQPDERVIDGKNDEVAARCANMSAQMNRGLGRKMLRVVVTTSAAWGTIWRADTSVPLGKGGDMRWRTVCWKTGDLERPLEMFDPKESIPPLK